MKAKQDISTDASKISSMFDGIAADYDRLNHILSFGTDILWRKSIVRKLVSEKSLSFGVGKDVRVLDIACGTGDLSFELSRQGFSVEGVDISDGMLDVARSKAEVFKCSHHSCPVFSHASAESLPYGDGTFDAVTISFGIRNFNNRKGCLHEIYRILKKGGVLYILEFAEPRLRLWKAVYGFYMMNILPLIGAAVSGDRNAYSYLPHSVKAFPKYDRFCEELSGAGFAETSWKSYSGGIAVLYKAYK